MWTKPNMNVAYPMIVDPSYHHFLSACPAQSPIEMQLHAQTIASPLASPVGGMLSHGSYDSLVHLGIPWAQILPQDLHGCPLTPALDYWKGEETPNHIILITILNPAYPITVEVIHTICKPYGNVQRIVIFRKNGLQSMVEFENIESATRAKEGLQGADIYSGCCTLKIQFAKPSKLNVFKNDSESWDFTSSALSGFQGEKQHHRPPLLQEPRGFGMDYPPMRSAGGGGGGMNGLGGPRNQPGLFNAPLAERFGLGGGSLSSGGLRGGPGIAGAGPGGPMFGRQGPPGSSSSLSMMGDPGHPHQGAVLMVYGLHKEKMNADKLFNLLCLFGNVVRVKFLKTKEGCAMVQMGDGSAVERCIENLNNTVFFENKMQLSYSKQAFLADVHQPYNLHDGTPSFKDYMGNKYNRFINPEMASKNRIQAPSKILHFFNTPPKIDEEKLQQVFDDHEVPVPRTVKIFPSKTERSSSGLLEFGDVSEALEALVCANHATISDSSSKFPYVMKLCFSSSRGGLMGRMKRDEDD